MNIDELDKKLSEQNIRRKEDREAERAEQKRRKTSKYLSQEANTIRELLQPGKRYPALRIIIASIRILAWVVGIAVFFATVIALEPRYSHNILSSGAVRGIISLAFAAIVVTIILSYAESINIFLDIEENTRMLVDMHKGESLKQLPENK